MFVDIVGCSEISNHKTLPQYNDFLQGFRTIFLEVTGQHRTSFYIDDWHRYFQTSVRGDEGLLMVFIPDRNDEIAKDIDTCVNVALDLKRRWLLCSENEARIKDSGLLPIELAFGVHLGKAYVNDDGDAGFRPEGYAINLTKRIESASRAGQFTHIFVSEAARGELDQLTDEITYTFGPAKTYPAKGISREICAYEVKHHSLPTDWQEVPEEYERRTRAIDFDPSEDEVALARQAHHENPTNLWLAEEFISLSLQYEYNKVVHEGKQGDRALIRERFAEAERVCRRLLAGEQRDAGLLGILGLIVGESGRYVEEQRAYRDAIRLEPQSAEGYWYLAYSLSYELSEILDQPEDRDWSSLDDLTEEQQGRVKEILMSYKDAIDLSPRQPYIRFDYAAELARWGQEDEAKEQLLHAIALNPKVRRLVEQEPYLQKMIRQDRRWSEPDTS